MVEESTMPAPEEGDPLTGGQRQRAEALTCARNVLASRSLTTVQSVDAVDLVNVASWIVSGIDPWGSHE